MSVLAIIIVVFYCFLLGFFAGYRTHRWRFNRKMLKKIQEYDDELRLQNETKERLSRKHRSLTRKIAELQH